MPDALQSALRRHWGYTSFRPGQQQIAAAVASGRDVLAVMSTGFGKSVCYQLPAVIRSGTCVVVSPLIALMTDQVSRLRRRGIQAARINSSCSASSTRKAWADAESGALKLLYMSPEQLGTDRFQRWVTQARLSFVAVDEAHCITEWGHAFRPAYRSIRRRLPTSTQLVAVTATATRSVRRDIARSLRMKSPIRFVGGFDRPNIFWEVQVEVNREAAVSRLLSGLSGTAIVYSPTRRGAERWASWLRDRQVNAVCYHAGMDKQDRADAMIHWLTSARCVMIATSAFGMGVDHPGVRLVVHLGMPGSLSAYYQEAGRAGRDGRPARAVLLYRSTDVPLQRAILARGLNGFAGKDRVRTADRLRMAKSRAEANRRLAAVQRYVQTRICRRHVLLSHFGEISRTQCGACDNCTRPTRSAEGTLIQQDRRGAGAASVHEMGGAVLVRELIDSGQISEAEILQRYFSAPRLRIPRQG